MSVLIKGMEMPTSCEDCPLGDSLHCQVLPSVPALWAEYTNAIREKRLHSDCPLAPVPPHGDLIDRDAYQYSGDLMDEPVIIPAEEKGENFCADCHWYESEQQYCFRKGCHAYDESSCELWEPIPADEPIPAPGGKTVPTTYDLLYEEGGYNSNGV